MGIDDWKFKQFINTAARHTAMHLAPAKHKYLTSIPIMLYQSLSTSKAIGLYIPTASVKEYSSIKTF